MRMAHFFGKQSLFFAAAAAMLIAGSGSAAAASTGQQVGLTGYNHTGYCVRFYVEGSTKDVRPGKTAYWGNAVANKQYMASVFSSAACGGKALLNTWYTTNRNAQQTWDVTNAKSIVH
ncbi:hypothetical protein ACQUKI_03660 [Ralstonia pseudosolanacearum]